MPHMMFYSLKYRPQSLFLIFSNVLLINEAMPKKLFFLFQILILEVIHSQSLCRCSPPYLRKVSHACSRCTKEASLDPAHSICSVTQRQRLCIKSVSYENDISTRLLANKTI